MVDSLFRSTLNTFSPTPHTLHPTLSPLSPQHTVLFTDLLLTAYCLLRTFYALPHALCYYLPVEVLAEKGGSRTLREPYDPQTGFEDQRHHRAPSFSMFVNSTT